MKYKKRVMQLIENQNNETSILFHSIKIFYINSAQRFLNLTSRF